jgi:hypothetical protein
MAVRKSTSSSKFRNLGKPWTEKQTNLLISSAGIRSVRFIASRVGRTVKAVRRKAESIGVSLAGF